MTLGIKRRKFFGGPASPGDIVLAHSASVNRRAKFAKPSEDG
jgi:hypothetical protein